MTDTARQQTIEKVADWIIKRSRGRIPADDYELILEHIINGYRILRTNHGVQGFAYKKETPDAINSFQIPSDCEEIIGIAVPINGKLWYLTRDDSIIITTTTTGGLEGQDEDVGEGVDLRTDSPSALYSRAKNSDGYYTIDWRNSRVMLNAISRTEVILVYKTSGTSVTDYTYIPNKYQPALIAYVRLEYWSEGDIGVTQKQLLQQQK